VAAAGEIVLSDEIVRAAGLDTSALRPDELQLKGIGHPVAAWSEGRAVTSLTP
jgi:class 3 adenylate cyclase